MIGLKRFRERLVLISITAPQGLLLEAMASGVGKPESRTGSGRITLRVNWTCRPGSRARGSLRVPSRTYAHQGTRAIRSSRGPALAARLQ